MSPITYYLATSPLHRLPASWPPDSPHVSCKPQPDTSSKNTPLIPSLPNSPTCEPPHQLRIPPTFQIPPGLAPHYFQLLPAWPVSHRHFHPRLHAGVHAASTTSPTPIFLLLRLLESHPVLHGTSKSSLQAAFSNLTFLSSLTFYSTYANRYQPPRGALGYMLLSTAS